MKAICVNAKMCIGICNILRPKNTPVQTSKYLVLPSTLKCSKQIKVIANVQIAVMQLLN